MQENLEWNEAQHKAKLIQQQKQESAIKEKQEREENINLAVGELWNALGSKHFRNSHFEEIAANYGLDEEDLIHRLM